MGQVGDVGRIGGFRIISEDDVAAVGGKDSGDHVEEGGFSGSAGADQGDLLAVGDKKFGDVDDGNAGGVRRDISFLQFVNKQSHGRLLAADDKNGRLAAI